MDETTNWVKIAETIHTAQAVSWQDILASEGILVIVDPPTNHSEPYPFTALAVHHEIFVKKEDEEKAHEILTSMSIALETEIPEIDQ